MIFDYTSNILNIKVVYFGPALSGKTTSMKSLFSQFGKDGKILSIETTTDRTLFFDYGSLSFVYGGISFQNKKWELKTHIYTTTGQDFYIVTRAITLRAVDGIIFVIDSQKDVYNRNLISWNELKSYFNDSINIIPIIIAFNKQDLENKFKPNKFMKEIKFDNYKNKKAKLTSAIKGEGILDCFKDMIKLIIKSTDEYREILAKN